jgi:hypothetical protein
MMSQQHDNLQRYLDEHYMPFVYNDLNVTNEQMDSKEQFEETFFYKVVTDEEHGFYKRWYEAEGSDIRADTVLLLFKENVNNLGHDWSPQYTVQDTVNAWAYSRGMKQFWKKIKDKMRHLPPNETEDACPICLRDYDRYSLAQDGPQNSDFNSLCNHWCCVECWSKIYYQENDKDTCPICRADITEWLKSHYPLDEDDDSQEDCY